MPTSERINGWPIDCQVSKAQGIFMAALPWAMFIYGYLYKTFLS